MTLLATSALAPCRLTGIAPALVTAAALAPSRAKLTWVDGERAQIEAAQRGDEAAFRWLIRHHQAQVARLVRRMLGSSNDCEDVVQEVFIQLHRSLKHFRAEARFSTWLHRVTVNVILMHLRQARSRPRFTEVADALLDVVDQRPLPEEQLAQNARLRAFERLLHRLSEKKRVVFVLHELEGLAAADIARIVGAPLLTVRTRLFYARRELAALLPSEPELARLLTDELGAATPATLLPHEREP